MNVLAHLKWAEDFLSRKSGNLRVKEFQESISAYIFRNCGQRLSVLFFEIKYFALYTVMCDKFSLKL